MSPQSLLNLLRQISVNSRPAWCTKASSRTARADIQRNSILEAKKGGQSKHNLWPTHKHTHTTQPHLSAIDCSHDPPSRLLKHPYTISASERCVCRAEGGAQRHRHTKQRTELQPSLRSRPELTLLISAMSHSVSLCTDPWILLGLGQCTVQRMSEHR